MPNAMSAEAANDNDTVPQLGSGGADRRRKKNEPRAPWELPNSEDFLKDGEATVKYFQDMVVRVRTEGADVRCGGLVLGNVEETFPRLVDALDLLDVHISQVEGLWVVPGFVIKGLEARTGWYETRGRLGAFLKNDIWRRVDGEAKQGLPVDWKKMSLAAENKVVVKYRATWRHFARAAAAHVSWAGAKAFAWKAYSGMTRANARALAVRLWPFKWSWLLYWFIFNLTIWTSLFATRSVAPISWHDVLTMWLANVMFLGYGMKARSSADHAIAEAEAFKRAGSIALRRQKLDVAAEQYKGGDQSASTLRSMWYLNSSYMERGLVLRVACRNNNSIVFLKQKEWEQAADLCAGTLKLDPPDPLARAKAHFRYAVAKAKLGETRMAIEALLLAHKLVPADKEVTGMLHVLKWGEQRRREREDDEMEAKELEDEFLFGTPSDVPAKASGDVDAAYGAITDPETASDAKGFGAWATVDDASPSPADATPSASAPGDSAAAPAHDAASAGGVVGDEDFADGESDEEDEEWEAAADGGFVRKVSPVPGFVRVRSKPGEGSSAKAATSRVEEVAAKATATVPPKPKAATAPPATKAAGQQPPAPKVVAAPASKVKVADKAAKPAAPPSKPPPPRPLPAGTASGAPAGGSRRVLKFSWSQDELRTRLVGLVCQHEDGTSFVGVSKLSDFRGEAYIERTKGARGKVTRVFDLSFDLNWQAKVSGETFEGSLSFRELSHHAEPSEVEVEAHFGENGPKDSSLAQTALIGLLGPLRAEAALAAEGRLTQQIWRRLLEFREAFAELQPPEDGE